MHGTERVRHCDACALNVYNLSAMTRDDAVQLVQNHEGRLCASFFRRVDGTVLTQDCPVSLRALRRRLASMTASVAALIGVLAAGTLFASTFRRASPAQVRQSGAVQRVLRWIDPPDINLPGDTLMGEMPWV